MTNIATCQSIYMNDVPTKGNFKVYTIHGASQEVEEHLSNLVETNSNHLIEEQKVDFAQLLRNYHGNFAVTKKDLG